MCESEGEGEGEGERKRGTTVYSTEVFELFFSQMEAYRISIILNGSSQSVDIKIRYIFYKCFLSSYGFSFILLYSFL